MLLVKLTVILEMRSQAALQAGSERQGVWNELLPVALNTLSSVLDVCLHNGGSCELPEAMQWYDILVEAYVRLSGMQVCQQVN